ncbi:MAG TPA: glutamate formimidoyltransferase [Chthoniobacterales bacterium]|nr:glutamate formimidoyltransferase [Chthoniobacterales bacterium]
MLPRLEREAAHKTMNKLIECVPNFSEGRDQNVIQQITAAIEAVDGVFLLDVDPGATTNRTVVTLVGDPEAVVEAAFRGIQKAAELIDMRKHKGAHPRMGATDVCPFVPISNVSWDEAVACARELGQRVGKELKIPVYLYEKAARDPSRSNLAVIRAGEYEGFAEKIKQPAWKPDFGPAVFNEKSGATVIGARQFLVAYNVNLNTKAVRRANSVAFDVREQGRVKTEDGTPTGKPVLDEKGEPVRVPGMLKHVKAIGWYVEEYGTTQVSINLTNIDETPLHAAFDACVESANNRGLRVTGSEIVGMVPKKCLLDAGRYFLRKQKWSEGASDEELMAMAVKSLGLSELKPFKPEEKVIELKIEAASDQKSLLRMDLRQFCNETLSDSPAPGGGSVAALMGALGASLGGMVANLSAGKRGWDQKVQYFSDWAVKAQQLKDELLFLVDEDTAAFNRVMSAFGLPKQSAEEKAARSGAIQEATKYAAEIPLRVMETAARSYQLLGEMAAQGNPASLSDVGVGLLATRACIEGAGLNVRINLGSLKDEKAKGDLTKEMERISAESEKRFQELNQVVLKKLA